MRGAQKIQAALESADSYVDAARTAGVSPQRVEQVRNPRKHAARKLTQAAIRFGLLVRPHCCDECGSACKPHAHHEDYEQPLDVDWLCRACHVLADRARRERTGEMLTPLRPRIDPFNPTFGSRLAGTRRTLQLAQESVAKRAGITQRHLSKLENNASKPSWGVAVAVAEAVGVSLDFLAGRTDRAHSHQL